MKSQFTKEYQLFISVLIQKRQERNLTQKTVAERLNKPQSFVSKYESGERRLDVCEFLSIAKALEESPFALLREMGISE